jgi:hypothetical protein
LESRSPPSGLFERWEAQRARHSLSQLRWLRSVNFHLSFPAWAEGLNLVVAGALLSITFNPAVFSAAIAFAGRESRS